MLGLCCCEGFSLVVVSGCYALIVVHRLLIAVASLVAEHRLWGTQASVAAAPGLSSTGLIVVAPGLSCSKACGIFVDQGWNPSLLHWQADSLPLSHQESPNVDHF